MKRLAFIPLILGVVASLGMFLDERASTNYHRVILIAVALVTGISAFVTAARFSKGDRLLASWIFLGSAYSIASIRYIVRLVGIYLAGVELPATVSSAMVVAQNVCIVLSLLLFVRAWRATGLAAPGSRAAQIGWIVAGIAIAVVVGGYPLAQGIANAEANPILIISTLGDMVGIALIVPLTIPALAMRGGLLMHTWVYLALMEVSWLLYDIWWALQEPLNLGRTGSSTLEAIRIVAIAFGFIATVAQRRALR